MPATPHWIKLLETNARVDLLITQVGPPGGLHGRRVADAARLVWPNLKVLFITSYAEDEVIGNGQIDGTCRSSPSRSRWTRSPGRLAKRPNADATGARDDFAYVTGGALRFQGGHAGGAG